MCRLQLKGLKKRYEDFCNAGAKIVAVSADPVQELQEFQNRSSIPFPLLSDVQCAVIKDYGVYNPSERDGIAIPATFIIDQSGVVRYANVRGTLFRNRTKRLLKEVQKL